MYSFVTVVIYARVSNLNMILSCQFVPIWWMFTVHRLLLKCNGQRNLILTSRQGLKSWILLVRGRVLWKENSTTTTEMKQRYTLFSQMQIKTEYDIIDYVQEYVYLGQSVSFHNSFHIEITRRISRAWKHCSNLMDKTWKPEIKRDVLVSCLLPVGLLL